jgi:hypothetical protein
LAGATYAGVWGGFAWSVEAVPDTSGAADGAVSYPPVVFYVDSIQWE